MNNLQILAKVFKDQETIYGLKEFASGNIILTDIDGQKTIKRFISDDHPPFIYLKPENPNYPIIPFTHKMRLVGQVISVLKDKNWKSVR